MPSIGSAIVARNEGRLAAAGWRTECATKQVPLQAGRHPLAPRPDDQPDARDHGPAVGGGDPARSPAAAAVTLWATPAATTSSRHQRGRGPGSCPKLAPARLDCPHGGRPAWAPAPRGPRGLRARLDSPHGARHPGGRHSRRHQPCLAAAARWLGAMIGCSHRRLWAWINSRGVPREIAPPSTRAGRMFGAPGSTYKKCDL